MQISDELRQLGINESIIEYFHNRTRNKHLKVTSVRKAINYSKTEPVDGVKVTVRLELNHIVKYAEYTINIAKIRNKKTKPTLKQIETWKHYL